MKDKEGHSPLWYAFYHGQPKFVQILMQNGAKIQKEPGVYNFMFSLEYTEVH